MSWVPTLLNGQGDGLACEVRGGGALRELLQELGDHHSGHLGLLPDAWEQEDTLQGTLGTPGTRYRVQAQGTQASHRSRRVTSTVASC